MAPAVNLHPERRRPLQETGTSRFFEPSTLPPSEGMGGDVEMKDAPAKRDRDDDGGDPLPKRRLRQAKLVFSDGKIATKVFKNPTSRDDDSRKALAAIATQTWKLLPGLLQTRPDVGTDGYLVQNENLDAKRCPNLSPIKVRVISSDTIDAALDLQSRRPASSSAKPVAILNMANAKSAGGGWKHGALAQEEAICYRTSLILTLKHDDYPIPDDAVIYSPRVMVIRDSIKTGHQVVDCTDPRRLKVVSVVSCAAVCQPSLKKDPVTAARTYLIANDKRLMLNKMRYILRTAIRRQHRQLVLGAFGCGAFGNPNTEVSVMWKTVLREPEFAGGYWDDIVFAVLGDSKADSNYKVFYDELDGLVLS